MSNYRNRPIFPFEIDWAQSVSRRFDYDLRTQQIGFGEELFEPLQNFLTVGFSFQIDLPSPCEINKAERFFAGVLGRQMGWWLPAPELAMEIVAGVSLTQFDIADIGLAESLALDAGHDVVLTSESGVQAFARITAVVANGALERVTIDTPLPALPDATWMVQRLCYVRLTEDAIEFDYYAEGRATLSITCAELPLEYGAAELGERPVWLYHFWRTQGATAQHWYFTSHDQAVTLAGHNYTPGPFAFGNLEASTEAKDDALEIESWMFEGNPLLLFYPFAPQQRLLVEVVEWYLVDALSTGVPDPVTLFSGQVMRVDPTGRRLKATCRTRIDALARKAPRFYLQKVCNHQLYNAATCGVNKAAFQVAAVIEQIGSTTINVTAAALAGKPANWFALGFASVNGSDGFAEVRLIKASAVIDGNTHQLALSAPFSDAAVGDAIVIAPGCDLRADTCQSKFNNFANFGGHPLMPAENLTLKAVKLKQASSGKGGGGK